ncbi:MAG: hypothetical protein EOO73_34875 [Myxococcales bacterium]|nr:MAG: hypothetical protein EOO73_34875 [Myxococcales bacterium]
MARTYQLLLPYRRFELRSGLSNVEAARALANSVERGRFRFQRGSVRFQQGPRGSTFAIQRVIRYRNTFLPRIDLHIREDGLGCSVSVTMGLPRPAQIFAMAWLMVPSAMLAVSFAGMLRHGGIGAAYIVFAGLLFASGWRMIVAGFSFEAIKAERILVKVLRADR